MAPTKDIIINWKKSVKKSLFVKCSILLLMLIYVLHVDCRKNRSISDRKFGHQKKSRLSVPISVHEKLPHPPRATYSSSSLSSKNNVCGVAKLNKIRDGKNRRIQYANSYSNIYNDEDMSYIMGGRIAPKGWFPWQVHLICSINRLGPTSSRCGGIIISPNRILTAAHCVSRPMFPCDYIQVIAGTRYLKGTPDNEDDLDTPMPQIVNATHYSFIYEKTERGHWLFDMSVLNLETKLEFNDFVQPICLPNGPISYNQCYTHGAGRQDYGATSGIVKFVRMSYDSNCMHGPNEPYFCFKAYGTKSEDRGVPCKGDSGSALACRQPGNVWFLAGIASYNMNIDCDPEHRKLWAGFTNIVHLSDLVREYDNKLSNYILYDRRDVHLVQSKVKKGSQIEIGPIGMKFNSIW